jgi:hypothetical protein
LAIICLSSLALAAYVLRQRDKEAAEWQRERQLLLTRIQAPEEAVRLTADRPKREPVPVIPVDDDQAFIEARERRLNGDPD